MGLFFCMKISTTQHDQITNLLLDYDLIDFCDLFFKRFHGGELYLVGGVVRDLLLKKTPHDIDFLVRNIAIDHFEEFLRMYDSDFLVVGKKFGVYKVVIGGKVFDFAFPRIESSFGFGYSDFSVQFDPFISLKDDSIRRDFSINALYISLDSYELFDFHGGVEALEEGVISFVGDGFKRLKEDKTRLFRAIRFAAQLDFVFSLRAISSIDHFVAEYDAYDFYRDQVISRELIRAFDIHALLTFEYLQKFGLLGCVFNPDFFALEHVSVSVFSDEKSSFRVFCYMMYISLEKTSFEQLLGELSRQLFLSKRFRKDIRTVVLMVMKIERNGFTSLPLYDVYQWYVAYERRDDLRWLHDVLGIGIDHDLVLKLEQMFAKKRVEDYFDGDEVMSYFSLKKGKEVGIVLKKLYTNFLERALRGESPDAHDVMKRFKDSMDE